MEWRCSKKASRAQTQAIVVEFIGGEVPEDVGAGLLGPGRDIDQSGGLTQSRRHQQAEDLAVGEFELGIWGQMAVDDVGDVKLVEQRLDQRQRTQIDDFLARAAPCQVSVMAPPLGEICKDMGRKQRGAFRVAFYCTKAVKAKRKK